MKLTEAEREQMAAWDNGCYSCACVDDCCPSLPCDNDRDDLTSTLERIITARAEQAWDEGYHAGLDHGRGGARLLNPDGSDPDYNPYRAARIARETR